MVDNKFNINKMENKLNIIMKKSNIYNNNFKETSKSIITKYDNSIPFDILLNIIDEDKRDYFIKNEAYKKYISQYSKEYIEMSDYYYGPELPYNIYINEFKKNNGTYLDNKESIKELYTLFMYYGLLQYYFFNNYE